MEVEPKSREHSKGVEKKVTQATHLNNMEDNTDTDNEELDQAYTDMADSSAHEPYNAAERTRNLMWDMSRDLEQEIQQMQNRNDIDEQEKRRLTNMMLNRPAQVAAEWDAPMEMYDDGHADDELEMENQQQQNLNQQGEIVNYIGHNTTNLPHSVLEEFRFGLDDERLVRRAREQIRQCGAAKFLWDMSTPQENKHDEARDQHQQQQVVTSTNNIQHHLEDEQEGEDPHLPPGDDALDDEQLKDQDNQMSEYYNDQRNIVMYESNSPNKDYKHSLIFDDKDLMRKIQQSARDGTMIQF